MSWLVARVHLLGNRTKQLLGSVHVELPTLLHGQALHVYIAMRSPDSFVLVNGFHEVMTPDVLASDGVVHVLD